jgi:hypothetical protein
LRKVCEIALDHVVAAAGQTDGISFGTCWRCRTEHACRSKKGRQNNEVSSHFMSPSVVERMMMLLNAGALVSPNQTIVFVFTIDFID